MILDNGRDLECESKLIFDTSWQLHLTIGKHKKFNENKFGIKHYQFVSNGNGHTWRKINNLFTKAKESFLLE